jgi:hypothetical protein
MSQHIIYSNNGDCLSTLDLPDVTGYYVYDAAGVPQQYTATPATPSTWVTAPTSEYWPANPPLSRVGQYQYYDSRCHEDAATTGELPERTCLPVPERHVSTECQDSAYALFPKPFSPAPSLSPILQYPTPPANTSELAHALLLPVVVAGQSTLRDDDDWYSDSEPSSPGPSPTVQAPGSILSSFHVQDPLQPPPSPTLASLALNPLAPRMFAHQLHAGVLEPVEDANATLMPWLLCDEEDASNGDTPAVGSTPAATARPSPTSSRRNPRDKVYQCKECRKWFDRPSALATHMNAHTGERRGSSVFYLSLLLLNSLSRQPTNARLQTATDTSPSSPTPSATRARMNELSPRHSSSSRTQS